MYVMPEKTSLGLTVEKLCVHGLILNTTQSQVEGQMESHAKWGKDVFN